MAKTCGSCEKGTVSGCVMENESTVIRWVRCSVTGKEHLDGHPCDVPDKPRLCEVLGVDVGQRFTVHVSDGDVDGPFFVRDDGRISCPVRDIGALDLFSALIEAINHPERIERVPRLTPEELQRCRDFGAKWVSRDNHRDTVDLWEEKPRVIPTELKCGIYGSAKRCAQTWSEYFPSVQPGQLVPVEGVS